MGYIFFSAIFSWRDLAMKSAFLLKDPQSWLTESLGTPLVVQWLALCLPMQGTWFPAWSGNWGPTSRLLPPLSSWTFTQRVLPGHPGEVGRVWKTCQGGWWEIKTDPTLWVQEFWTPANVFNPLGTLQWSQCSTDTQVHKLLLEQSMAGSDFTSHSQLLRQFCICFWMAVRLTLLTYSRPSYTKCTAAVWPCCFTPTCLCCHPLCWDWLSLSTSCSCLRSLGNGRSSKFWQECIAHSQRKGERPKVPTVIP